MTTHEGYVLRPMGTFALIEIKATGSGPVPVSLRGRFTSPAEAIRAIDVHVNSTKRKTHGKAKGGSTG